MIFRLPEVPLPGVEQRRPDRRGSHPRGDPRRGVRRHETGRDACLSGRLQRTGQPETPAALRPCHLYEVGTAVVVALTFAPQLVEDARRVARPAGCEGHRPPGWWEIGRLAVPVLVGALERSLGTRRVDGVRGYGRSVQDAPRDPDGIAPASDRGRLTGVLVGLYGLLDGTSPVLLGAPVLGLGLIFTVAALTVGARCEPPQPLPPRPLGGRGMEWWLPVAWCPRWPWSWPPCGSGRAWSRVQVPAGLPEVPLLLVSRDPHRSAAGRGWRRSRRCWRRPGRTPDDRLRRRLRLVRRPGSGPGSPSCRAPSFSLEEGELDPGRRTDRLGQVDAVALR